jgi:serine/threonine-protein kinase
MASKPIRQLGRYRILDELGRGAMGIVYKAEDPILDRPLAIKTIFIPVDEEDRKEYEARFNQEARAAGRLAHPGIVTIYDVGREGEMVYMAMEMLEGVDLAARAQQRRFSVAETLEIAAQVADALAFAHDRGVVHRDIKPPNIMIIDKDRVKLMDFGIARIRQSDLKTQTGVMLGTPRYMSPEQVSGRPTDHRSDIFSLGTVLYEMLTGSKLYAGGDPSEVMYNVVNLQPVPPSYINRQVPPMLDLVVAKALQKDADARYQDAHQFADDLRACLTELHASSASSDETINTEPLSSAPKASESTGTRRINGACAQGDDEPTLAQNNQDSAPKTVTLTAAATKSPLRAPTITVEANTRLPVSRAFDCDTALERLTNPTSKDRARLVRPPKYPGLFKRVLRDRESRILAVAILIAAAISLLVITY